MEEVAADMLAVYGVFIEPEVDDFGPLSGPRFLSLAQRLPYYPGAVRGVLTREIRKRDTETAEIGTALTPDMLASGIGGANINYKRTVVEE